MTPSPSATSASPPSLSADQQTRPWWRRSGTRRRGGLRLVGRRAARTPSEYIVGAFATEAELLRAVEKLRQAGCIIDDVFTPYPIHELSHLLGVRRSRLGWATFCAGAIGASSAFGFQLWSAAVSWPINVGGKPGNSALAFIPVTFEVTILLGGLTTAAAFLLRSRLGPGVRGRRPAPDVTDDRFAIVIDATRSEMNAEGIRRLLRGQGAESVAELGRAS